MVNFMDTVNNRGSIWRKWDLHLHSFNTTINNNFGDDEDSYLNKIIEEKISVVGLTNYFNFSNEDFSLRDRLLEKGVQVFLNLELRLTYTNKEDDCLDLHIIFSDSVDKNLINTFLTKLNAFIGGNTKILKDIISNEEKNAAVVEFNDIKNLINKDESLRNLKNNILIGFLSRGKGNSRSSSMYESLSKECNFLIHSTDKVENISEDIKYWSSYNKPLLNSSDAHRIDNIGSKFTWIKANPTFEGLKQIIYEPTDRVKIQELEPEEKEDYQVIDSVKFIDNSFTPHEIVINQNLTTIIGGKSTGKSILLRNIAQTIDSEEVSKRLEETNIIPYKDEVSGFQVTWRDGQENKKNEDTEVNKKIIYIPQSYLNRLVDKKEDKTSIDDIIKSVLEQEGGVKNVFAELQTKNREIEQTITQNIEELFYKENDIKNLSENIKKVGDKKGISSEINKLSKEITELKKKAGMNDEEIKNYNEIFIKITDLKATQEKAEVDLQSIGTLQSQKNFGIFPAALELLNSLGLEVKKSLQDNLNIALKEAEIKWHQAIELEYKKLEKQKINNQSELEKLGASFKPLLEKAQKSKSLDEKIKKLEEQQQKSKEINIQEKNLQTLKNDYDVLIKNIAKDHSQFFNNFFNAKTKILEQRSITKNQDLKFGIEVLFESNAFQESCINDICDQRKLSQFKNGFLQNYEYSDSVNFKVDIVTIIQAILTKEITLKGSYSKKEAITKFTHPWFVFDYKIKQNGDEISEMSPGKKSFVLLKLLIELDNSKCPILLDQPEDDLDNRSIYNDLVKFIKTKKKERQIIIATHNPNLVVGADSECVIVANQNGDVTKNKTYQFEYVQGALEDAFLNEESSYILEQRGIQEHVCDILEGGKEAFTTRRQKLNIK